MGYLSGGFRNALVGINAPRAVSNGLQPTQGMPPQGMPTQGMPFQQHPMIYQQPQQMPTSGVQPPMSGAGPLGQWGEQVGPQWPNPHQGAYQDWMQQFSAGGARGRRTMRY